MRFITTIFAVVCCLIVSGCQEDQENNSTESKQLMVQAKDIPEGMKDCQFYKIDPGLAYPYLYTVRCPNSVTASKWKQGKTLHNAIVDTCTDQPTDAERLQAEAVRRRNELLSNMSPADRELFKSTNPTN